MWYNIKKNSEGPHDFTIHVIHIDTIVIADWHNDLVIFLFSNVFNIDTIVIADWHNDLVIFLFSNVFNIFLI